MPDDLKERLERAEGLLRQAMRGRYLVGHPRIPEDCECLYHRVEAFLAPAPPEPPPPMQGSVDGITWVDHVPGAPTEPYQYMRPKDPRNVIGSMPAAAVPLKEPTCGRCGGSRLIVVRVGPWTDSLPCPDCRPRNPEVTR